MMKIKSLASILLLAAACARSGQTSQTKSIRFFDDKSQAGIVCTQKNKVYWLYCPGNINQQICDTSVCNSVTSPIAEDKYLESSPIYSGKHARTDDGLINAKTELETEQENQASEEILSKLREDIASLERLLTLRDDLRKQDAVYTVTGTVSPKRKFGLNEILAPFKTKVAAENAEREARERQEENERKEAKRRWDEQLEAARRREQETADRQNQCQQGCTSTYHSCMASCDTSSDLAFFCAGDCGRTYDSCSDGCRQIQ